MTKPLIRNWSWIVVLLLAWGLRLCCLETVPPGWRDDELVHIHALSGELLAGRFLFYYTGASGHEPLYHHLNAGVHAVLGFSVLSGHILSVTLGTLSIALTYTLTRRLFGRAAALVASLALTTSFWSLMYSRTVMRQISLLPVAIAFLYVFWRSVQKTYLQRSVGARTWMLVGLLLGVSLYTYTAARLLPAMLVVFAVYLALFHRDSFRRCWRGILLALVVAGVSVTPMGIAIAQGRSASAAQGIGADARLDELALPLKELRAGNLRPLLEYTWTTLGMFHATGDPEWLYNIAGRPVFNLLGGALVWGGVALCLYRWRRPRDFFLLLWLGAGLLPAFISTPPASLSHTLLAQPVAYILPALVFTEAQQRLTTRKPLLFIIHCSLFVFLATNAVRDLRDYFVVWPQRGMVRFLYRADYREAANYLSAHPEITDIAVASNLMGPWDRLALDVDIQRDDVAVRLFDPTRALVWSGESTPATVLMTTSYKPTSPLADLLEAHSEAPTAISSCLKLYTLRDSPFAPTVAVGVRHSPRPRRPLRSARSAFARFANYLELVDAHWMDASLVSPGQEAILFTAWRVAATLDLPPIPIVAYPPPPGVYFGPRLAVFTHLLAADGAAATGDDGLWVDPLTLRPGDRFVQIHRFLLPPDAPDGPYTLELGLYDPMTGERWSVLDAAGQPGADHVLLSTASK